ncbi:MAG: hypothetical protein CVV35_13360, partial [Methanomicrobiales archaeon HGW-Methanomicrobiales-6]
MWCRNEDSLIQEDEESPQDQFFMVNPLRRVIDCIPDTDSRGTAHLGCSNDRRAASRQSKTFGLLLRCPVRTSPIAMTAPAP